MNGWVKKNQEHVSIDVALILSETFLRSDERF